MLIRQVKAVLMTYLARRAYHLLLLGIAFGVVIPWVKEYFRHSLDPVWHALLATLWLFLLPGSVVATIVLFFHQAREQLMGKSARLLPQSRSAHLIVIGFLFFAISVSVSTPWWEWPRVEADIGGNFYWNPGVSPVGAVLASMWRPSAVPPVAV